MYKKFVLTLILIPNIFVITLGVESFPLTCAPMFGHYINDDTDLFLLKFEGEKDSVKIDLVDYYGKPEDLFVRHFFSKVYASTKPISPFSNKLTETPEAFENRMNSFFINYTKFIDEEYNLFFDKINVSVKKVNQKRNALSDYEMIGFFDSKENSYNSLSKK